MVSVTPLTRIVTELEVAGEVDGVWRESALGVVGAAPTPVTGRVACESLVMHFCPIGSVRVLKCAVQYSIGRVRHCNC